MKFLLRAWPLLVAGTCCAADESKDTERIVYQFIGNYCLECHDSAVQKADRDFEAFELPLQKEFDLITAQEIIDQVTLKEMPPKKADQPSDEERIAVVRVLREKVEGLRGKLEGHASGRTVMRRLSMREYENTLEQLFGRRVDTLGLTADFPKENTSEHIDTIGATLVTSGFLLDQYFQAANRLVDLRLGKPLVEPKTWHFTDNFRQYEELTGAHGSVFNFGYLCLYEQPNTDTRQGGYGHIEDFLEGVPVSGYYEISALAQAYHRDTHYDPKIFKIDFSEPFLLGVVPGDVKKGHIHYPQAIEPLLGQKVVPDDKQEWLKFRVWLEKGQTPRFIFPNGPWESRASVITVNKRYKDEFDPKKYRSGVSRAHILREGALPHIRIDEIKIHGPLPEPGGTKEEIAVFGRKGFQNGNAKDQLFAFGERAFRRPLNGSDRKRIEAAYQKRLSEKATPREAALDTVKMILCSPSFIYLAEVTDEEQVELGAYDLASRLSYALWALPPDEALMASAQSGELLKAEELERQVRRLLAHENSAGFVEGFLDSWLNLRDIGSQPPPRGAAGLYYYQNLPASMKEEARLFFAHVLKENRSVADFINADYTFVDKYLAGLYQLPEKETMRLADGFEKVSLKGNARRGGVLGMAGVLTVSANGVDTSPITRGVWVWENILGVQPPPPPDEVPDIDADTRGATTIREKLKKHREDRACAECHRKIDPLGFPLETFDPIGRWRERYRGGDGSGLKVDASGEFASGETFVNFREFKQVLVDTRKDAFTRGLISKLLSYSTGRLMEPVDRYIIDDIHEKVKEDDYGFETLVVEVMTSGIMRSR